MIIQTENQLVEELARKLKREFNTDTAVREFHAGYGIADLAFARNFYSSKNQLDREPINNYYALKCLLSLSQNKYFSNKDILGAIGVSQSLGRKITQLLITKNYIKRAGRDLYVNTCSIMNPIKNLIAIEVKLKDWKQGILQARRYKSFTDECYLAILSKFEKNIDYNYLERFGIGLILFHPESGNILVKKHPSKSTLMNLYDDLLDLFAKEEFLYRTITNISLVSLSR